MAKRNAKSGATHLLRVIKQELLIDDTMYVEGFCISTDEKITAINGFKIAIGSKLTEVDTGKVYLFDPSDGAGWTDQSFPENG